MQNISGKYMPFLFGISGLIAGFCISLDRRLPLSTIQASGLGCVLGMVVGLVVWWVKYLRGEDQVPVGDHSDIYVSESDLVNQVPIPATRLGGLFFTLMGFGLLGLNHAIFIFQNSVYLILIIVGCLFVSQGICGIIYPKILLRWDQAKHVPWIIIFWYFVVFTTSASLVWFLCIEVYGF